MIQIKAINTKETHPTIINCVSASDALEVLKKCNHLRHFLLLYKVEDTLESDGCFSIIVNYLSLKNFIIDHSKDLIITYENDDINLF